MGGGLDVGSMVVYQFYSLFIPFKTSNSFLSNRKIARTATIGNYTGDLQEACGRVLTDHLMDQ